MYLKLTVTALLMLNLELVTCGCQLRIEALDHVSPWDGFDIHYLGHVLRCTSITLDKEKSLLETYNLEMDQDERTILIENSSIPFIDRHTFDQFKSVQKLYLNKDNIKDIQPNSFIHMEYLEEVMLTNNKISNISKGVFNGNDKLKKLDLSFNLMTSLKNISDLVNLEELIATNNKISFNENIFQNMNLKALNLNGNKLGTLNFINQVHTLEVLNVSSTWLKKIFKNDFQKLINLKFIDLSDNFLDDLPAKLFENLHNLTHLNLASNNLKTFSSQIFYKPIQYLNLFDNIIDKIESSQLEGDIILSQNYLVNLLHFSGHITNIDFSINRVTEIKNGSLENLKQLTYLKLSENAITTIDNNAFKNLFALNTLLLDKNVITSLEIGTFSDLNNLTTLQLSSNLIKHLQIGVFTGLHNLNTLNLADNSIEYIDATTFFSIPNLQYLYLHENPLITIDESNLNHVLSSLVYLSINIEKIGCNTLQFKLHRLEENEVIVQQGPEVKGPNVHGIACDKDEEEINFHYNDYLKWFDDHTATIRTFFYLSIVMFILLFASHMLSWYQKRYTYIKSKNNGAACSLALLTDNNEV